MSLADVIENKRRDGHVLAVKYLEARAPKLSVRPEDTAISYVLARMAGRDNECLRALARSRGLQVIDLDAWGRTALEPHADYFFDSVHLYEEGQRLIGAHLAEALAPDVPSPARAPKPAKPLRPRSGRPASASRT